MLRVSEHYSATDTGRQRRANEDSLLARPPLFVVADGMGGAQAGEVASRIAVESFVEGLPDQSDPERGLASRVQAANARIHELSQSNVEQAGMGTTLTTLYVGEQEVVLAHVGDSRAYCLRDGALLKLTDDHSLVDELIREGKLTPAEAEEHPQRSIITRALGPEATVEVDLRSFRARSADVYLLCSDGLTSMVSEPQIEEILRRRTSLEEAGQALIAAANEAGGRDNITVVLIRLEDVQMSGLEGHDPPTMTGVPAVQASAEHPAPRPGAGVRRRRPRAPSPNGGPHRAGRGRRLARLSVSTLVALVVAGVLVGGALLAFQSVFFIGTNERGMVTLYRGVPYELPGGLKLYSSDFVSGVNASTISPARRRTLLDHSLLSESKAAGLVDQLELGELSGG
jgi:PPM family protein phosphatase